MGGQPYTSRLIASWDRFSFTYGVAEARLKLPRGNGLWPGFWMMPESRAWPPELDIMEAGCADPSRNVMTVHWGTTPQDHQSDSTVWTGGPDFSADFHVFTLEWSANALVWYIDGIQRKQYMVSANIPQVAMYIILNLAVSSGGWTGTPDATTVFPAVYEIDYVRVWQR
jgi:beta-glucanase (GH16 family)